MSGLAGNVLLDYRGHEWVRAPLPTEVRPWLTHDVIDDGRGSAEQITPQQAAAYLRDKAWSLPDREHFFFSDLHADADALLASLVASGGVEKTGPGDTQYVLTPRGRAGVFVFGGDYFDKGPSNLRLLRTLRHLIDLEARVVLLAGNHDVRTLLGIRFAEAQGPRTAHKFIRMGKKCLTLLREVFDAHVRHLRGLVLLPDSEVAARLFPGEAWYREFPAAVAGLVPERRIANEVERVRAKCAAFPRQAAKKDMTLGMVHAAVRACQRLFTDTAGDVSWLYERMNVAYRAGSVLFAHAGIDDTMAGFVRRRGVDAVNQWFRESLDRQPFELYNGPLGNMFRTKYRDVDFPLTRAGVDDLHAAGIWAIAHGHRSLDCGQRITLRQGMLNFECDASIDRNTRRAAGLPGHGVAVTVFGPERVLAVCADHDHARELRPDDVGVPRSGPGGRGLTMPGREREFHHESLHEVRSVADYLAEITRAVSEGRVRVSDGADGMVLEPNGLVRFEVTGFEHSGRAGLTIAMSWQSQNNVSPRKLQISAVPGSSDGEEPPS